MSSRHQDPRRYDTTHTSAKQYQLFPTAASEYQWDTYTSYPIRWEMGSTAREVRQVRVCVVLVVLYRAVPFVEFEFKLQLTWLDLIRFNSTHLNSIQFNSIRHLHTYILLRLQAGIPPSRNMGIDTSPYPYLYVVDTYLFTDSSSIWIKERRCQDRLVGRCPPSFPPPGVAN